ncbi:MAG: hypothetical protein V1850_01150 [Candidatus Bathyarchaeota archaeon]
MRGMKDRDFLRTLEGFLFCVVGYSHPRDKVISYLKYVPSNEGLWGKEGERYSRTMPNYTIPSLLNNIEMLRKNYPRYVFNSRILKIQMSVVPHDCIVEHYLPELKLQTLFRLKDLDPLQEATVEFASFLHREAGVSKDDFGITGSILTGIHNPRFSDIDLIVYGGENAWKVKRMLKEMPESVSLLRHQNRRLQETLKRWVKNYPLTKREAETIKVRRWNYGRFHDRYFSIHAVRKDVEIVEKYGDKCFFPQGIVEGRAEIIGVTESLFLPCTYSVNGLEVKLENVVEEIGEIVSYDGFYSGLFDCGEYISVRGKLEKVVDKNGDTYLRVLIGSPEAKGSDYIKPEISN